MKDGMNGMNGNMKCHEGGGNEKWRMLVGRNWRDKRTSDLFHHYCPPGDTETQTQKPSSDRRTV